MRHSADAPQTGPVPQPTRVLLCGDQVVYRSALRSLIESREDFRIVAESANDVPRVEKALETDVELVLIDYDLATDSGRQDSNFEALLERVAPRPTVVLSSEIDPHTCHTALKLGVSGIVLKEKGGQALLEAMETVKRGQVWLERSVLTAMFAESSHTRRTSCGEQGRIDQLTPRECEIVEVACTGVTNKQIAERLTISEATVRHHLASIFAKLRVSSRSELIVYAYRHSLTSLPDSA